jgi:DNA topoisomerase IA
MRIAQRLYEEGYITYMRTDSVNLSQEAINSAKDFIEKEFGADILRQEIIPRNLHLHKKRTKRFVRLIFL